MSNVIAKKVRLIDIKIFLGVKSQLAKDAILIAFVAEG